MATHGDIGLAEPGGTSNTAKLDAISLNLNSTVVLREVMVIGDPESSVAIARASSVVPKSTDVGLNVRIISGPSTAADAVIRVNQGVGISSVADAWKTGPSDTNWASSAGFHVTSSGALRVAGNKSSNATDYLSVRLTNGAAFLAPSADYTALSTMNISTVTGLAPMLRSGAAIGGTTDTFQMHWGSSNGALYMTPISSTGEAMTSTGVVGSTMPAVNVREAAPSVTNFAVSTAFNNSTELAIGTSNAASKNYVFAYCVTSTIASPIVVGFYDGTTLKWPMTLSSGYGGANLAVTPPAYLFAGSTGSSMSIRVVGSSNGGITVGVSYFTGA